MHHEAHCKDKPDEDLQTGSAPYVLQEDLPPDVWMAQAYTTGMSWHHRQWNPSVLHQKLLPGQWLPL